VSGSSALPALLGCAGVDRDENRRARQVALLFELPMLLAALWVALNWWALRNTPSALLPIDRYDLPLWLLFVLESLVVASLCDQPRRYLRRNWLNLVVVVAGLPLLVGVDSAFGALRLVRLIALAAIAIHVGSRVGRMLQRNQLLPTLIASTIVIVMSGIMMAALDPAIKTPADGIWWAWVTVSTVGYGDLVPISASGRWMASVVMLLGLGLFSLITGAFVAFFMEKKEQEVEDLILLEQQRIVDQLELLHRRLDEIEHLVERVGRSGSSAARH